MNNCEEKIPTASSTPTPVVQDIRCYTIEDLMAMLILSRPTVCRLLKQNFAGSKLVVPIVSPKPASMRG